MAKLNIQAEFTASHGTRDVKGSNFRVVLCFQGPLVGDFVGAVDFAEARRALESAVQELDVKYLDDVVGRATIENIACYVLFRTRQVGAWSASVETGAGVAVTVTVQDLALDDYDAVLHYKRGASLLVRQRFPEALRELNEAISLKPNLVEAIICRGRCHRRLGDLHAAIREFQLAVAVAHDCGEAWRNLANALCELEHYEEMMVAFDKAVELMPLSALARNNRGFALQKLSRMEEAVGDHTAAIELDSTYSEAFGDRAEAYLALGLTELAEEDWATMSRLQALEEPDTREWLKTRRTTEIDDGSETALHDSVGDA